MVLFKKHQNYRKCYLNLMNDLKLMFSVQKKILAIGIFLLRTQFICRLDNIYNNVTRIFYVMVLNKTWILIFMTVGWVRGEQGIFRSGISDLSWLWIISVSGTGFQRLQSIRSFLEMLHYNLSILTCVPPVAWVTPCKAHRYTWSVGRDLLWAHLHGRSSPHQ